MPDTQMKDGCTIRPYFLPKNERERHTPRLLLAYNAPREALSLAESLGCAALRIPPWDRLSAPVSGHPDMLVFPLPDGSLLLPSEYYNAHADFWAQTGISARLTEHSFGDRYPADVGLNQLVIGGRLYGRLDAAAEEIRDAYAAHTQVRQGYARCSLLKLSEDAAVTADRSLAAALTAHGIDVLLIRTGHIRLDGYDYGFIGGVSFPLPDGSVGLFGELSAHPDCHAITDFAERHGVKLHSLPCELTDYGGGVLLR